MQQEPKKQRVSFLALSVLTLLLIGVAIGVYMVTRPVKKEATIDRDTGPNASLVAAGCKVSDKLVNSCRPWIGATANSYPGVSGWEAQVLNFEKRAGRMADVVHNYHSPTQTSLNKSELKFINRGTQLLANWKPDTIWRNADGRNATVNARIDQMAASIKTVSPKKIFLAIYAEPENDISKGGSKCSREVGNKGTTAEYRAMWKNVRKRFDAKGVTNVVWVMNYMGWSGWDCAIKDLWPGNNLVDWITWDPYTSDKGDFNKDISRFGTFLSENSDSTHAFTSKPWGISEMGYEGYDQKKAYKYYDDMAASIAAHRNPRIQMYVFFDMNGKDFGGDPGWDSRIAYARNKKADATEQSHFNAMFKKVAGLTPTVSIPTDVTLPKVSITSPAHGGVVSGKLNVAGTASDNNKVKAVTIRVDTTWIATDETAPYTFQLDTTKFKNGKHTIYLRAWDFNENKADAKLEVDIRN